ncbi:hypothetical protein [Geobacter sp. FeAm09]|nr:hypothetical protein [Geobacter sp. FeAm09]
MKAKSTILILACFFLTVLCTLAYGWTEKSNAASEVDMRNYDAQSFIY